MNNCELRRKSKCAKSWRFLYLLQKHAFWPLWSTHSLEKPAKRCPFWKISIPLFWRKLFWKLFLSNLWSDPKYFSKKISSLLLTILAIYLRPSWRIEIRWQLSIFVKSLQECEKCIVYKISHRLSGPIFFLTQNFSTKKIILKIEIFDFWKKVS